MEAKPKQRPLQPATREKTCAVCGATYVYPEKGSAATRFHCAVCATLPEHLRKILGRMAARIRELEKALPAG